MAVLSLNSALGQSEPAPSWLWTLTLIGPNGIIIPPARILEAPAPFYSIASESVQVAGQSLKLPSNASLENMNVTFYESFNYSSLQLALLWRNQVRDSQGNFGLPLDYVGMGLFELYDSAGYPQFAYLIDGLWISTVSIPALSYNESSAMTVSVTLETYSEALQLSLFSLGAGLLGAALPGVGSTVSNLGLSLSTFS